jgi:hypothetical protein
MRIDELQHDLAAARDAVPAADPVVGRVATNRRVRRHQVRQAVAVAGAVLVVVLVVASVGRFGRNDALPVLTDPGPAPTPHLATGYAPDGLTPYAVYATPIEGHTEMVDAVRSTRTAIFAKASAAADADLGGDTFAITVNVADPSRPHRPFGTTPTGAAEIHQSDLGDGLHTTTTIDVHGNAIAVSSRTLDDGQREAVLRSVLATSSGQALDQITPPAGYLLVDTSTYFGQIASGNTIASLGADGTIIVFEDTAPTALPHRPRLLAVSQVKAADLDVLRWFLVGERTVEVRGHDAVIGSYHAGESMSVTQSAGGPGTSIVTTEFRGTVLAWVEADGTVMIVQGNGIGDDELEHVVADLHAVPDDEWQAWTADVNNRALPANCTATADGGRVCGSTGTRGPTQAQAAVTTTTPWPAPDVRGRGSCAATCR